MSSTNRIDYSLRQNKAIERGIVFDGMRKVMERLALGPSSVYIGFGSVWFTDFHLAHRHLGIREMISLESDEVTARRAEFNKPYRTIRVIPGDSEDKLPELLEEPELQDRPWVVWLDYDQALGEDRLEQIDDMVRYLPPDSYLVATFSATPGQYGKPAVRPRTLKRLFGFAMAEEPDVEAVREEVDLARILSETLEARMQALAIEAGRPPAIPSFRLRYRDGVTMVTVGIFLPSGGSKETVQSIVDDPEWAGLVPEAIMTPPLTAQEVAALRALLPASGSLTRSDVNACGFDLEDDQLSAFAAHYLRYPTFAQLAL